MGDMTIRLSPTGGTLLALAAATYVPVLAIHALCITGRGWVIAGVEVFNLVPISRPVAAA